MKFSKQFSVSLIAIAVVLMTSSLLAGEKINTEGMWALQFGIEAETRLTSFQGTALSLQKTTNAGAIWRMGLGMNFFTQNRESEQSDEDSSYVISTDDNGSTTISFTLQRLFKLSSSTRIHPYVGIGPLVSYSHNSSEHIAPLQPIDERSNDSWALGARTVFGAEWFVTSYLSLLGEYSLDASYGWAKSKHTRTYDTSGGFETFVTETKTNSFKVSPGSTRLAVSLYF
jgi:hypothetical protein